MAWLKKFIEYSREINDYTELCTCPAHSEYHTAVIFHSTKKLKLNLEILQHIDSSNPIVPKGIEFSGLNNAHKKIIFEDKLPIKFTCKKSYDTSTYATVQNTPLR